MLKNLSMIIGTIVAYESLVISRRALRLRELEHEARMKLLDAETKEQQNA